MAVMDLSHTLDLELSRLKLGATVCPPHKSTGTVFKLNSSSSSCDMTLGQQPAWYMAMSYKNSWLINNHVWKNVLGAVTEGSGERRLSYMLWFQHCPWLEGYTPLDLFARSAGGSYRYVCVFFLFGCMNLGGTWVGAWLVAGGNTKLCFAND